MCVPGFVGARVYGGFNMQAATSEEISVQRVASPVAGESGLSRDELANSIRVSASKGDQYHKKAGLLLLEAKRRSPSLG
jgi:hypothetical protein